MRRTPALAALALTVLAAGCAAPRGTAYDVTGDGKADVIILDGEATAWFNADGSVYRSGPVHGFPTHADFTGDRRTDIAFVGAGGTYYDDAGSVMATFSLPQPFHPNNSWAVPADWDGDGVAEPAIFQDHDGSFHIDGLPTITLGTNGTYANSSFDHDRELPVVADYDGDRKADAAHWSPRTGMWTIRHSSTGQITTTVLHVPWNAIEYPVPADYDGDGRAEPAVLSADGFRIAGRGVVSLGDGRPKAMLPAVADYDGNGTADLAYVDAGSNFRIVGTDSSIPMGGGTFQGEYDLRRAPIAANGAWIVVHVARLTLIAYRNANPGCC